jgi:hypothetical protein
MMKIIIAIVFALTTMQSFGQLDRKQNGNTSTQNNNAVVYRLFPTQNNSTFIKLNTRNGKMWHVQYDLKEGFNRFTTPLSIEPLVAKEKEINDRFTLYSTQSANTYILLDQLDGRIWQVTWATEPTSRGILPIPD